MFYYDFIDTCIKRSESRGEWGEFLFLLSSPFPPELASLTDSFSRLRRSFLPSRLTGTPSYVGYTWRVLNTRHVFGMAKIVFYEHAQRQKTKNLWKSFRFSVLFSFRVLFSLFSNCAHIVGWLLLKWSTIGLGFDGAETNCRIAHILGTLLMISYWFHFYFSDIIVVCAV